MKVLRLVGLALVLVLAIRWLDWLLWPALIPLVAIWVLMVAVYIIAIRNRRL